MREWTLDQANGDAPAGFVGVAGDEGFLQTTKRHPYFRGHALRILLQDARMVAPGQEIGVMVHIRHQRIHFFGAVPDEDGFVDCFHGNGA
ncbi:hypothetical protein D3C71_2108510 [compost metagenome]